MPPSILRSLVKTSVVVRVGAMAVALLCAATLTGTSVAHAAKSYTNTFYSTVSIAGHGYGRANIHGRVTNTENSYSLEGRVEFECKYKDGVGTVHWKAVGGAKKEQSFACSTSSGGGTKPIKQGATKFNRAVTPAIDSWVCYTKLNESKCSPRDRTYFGKPVEVADNDYFENAVFEGGIQQSEGGKKYALAGTFKIKTPFTVFCREYLFAIAYWGVRPGQEAREIKLTCTDVETKPVPKSINVARDLPTGSQVELWVCVFDLKARQSCGKHQKVSP